MMGFDVHVSASSSVGEQAAFAEVRTLHVCVRCLDLVELLVKCPIFASYQFFLVLCPICTSLVKTGRSGQLLASSSSAHDITSAIRFLKISDLDVLVRPAPCGAQRHPLHEC